MNLIERTQAILLKPRQAWPAIDVEPATTSSIYTNWLVFMAAIPAVAGFIGLSLIGAGAFGISYRIPVVAGIVHMILSYVMSLVAVFVVALIVDALAPTFSGTKSKLGALKLVAYGSVAGFLGGIFTLLPSLSVLGLLASLYSIYLIYIGVPVLMKCPPEKAAAYTAVVVVCAIVAMIVLGAIAALAMPGRLFGPGMVSSAASDGAAAFTIKTPDGEVAIDSTHVQAMTGKMEAARARMEAAQKSGDPAATSKALGEMMSAVTGGGGAPIAPADLKALLPETLGGLKRESSESSGNQAMGLSTSIAKASYGDGDKHVELSITDLGGMAGVATMAGWANMTVDKETTDSVEKIYKEGSRTLHEEFQKDGSHGQYTVILNNGVIVEAVGDKVDMSTLKKLAGGVDLGAVEALKHAARGPQAS